MTIFKPYQLVLVNAGEYKYIGEVMSFITPSNTVMVRKAPSMPATLVELDIACIERGLVTNARRYLHFADVKHISGPAVFPIDMLRREIASPVNFNPETSAIDLSMGVDSPMMVAKLTTVRDALWNYDRWKSFGYEVEHTLTERFVQV